MGCNNRDGLYRARARMEPGAIRSCCPGVGFYYEGSLDVKGSRVAFTPTNVPFGSLILNWLLKNKRLRKDL